MIETVNMPTVALQHIMTETFKEALIKASKSQANRRR